MDELVDSMRKTNTHCGEEEYLNLLSHIELCKFYTNPIDAAKKSKNAIQRYFSEINLDPIHYSIIEHVSLKNFNYIVELSNLKNNYENVLIKFPYDYDKHIASALKFFELLREGAEFGYFIYPSL